MRISDLKYFHYSLIPLQEPGPKTFFMGLSKYIWASPFHPILEGRNAGKHHVL